MYCYIWCSALGVVAEVLRRRCVVLCTVCKFVSDCAFCASSWYLSPFSYMMHGHAYIKGRSTFIYYSHFYKLLLLGILQHF
jgi:hypothetical protein